MFFRIHSYRMSFLLGPIAAVLAAFLVMTGNAAADPASEERIGRIQAALLYNAVKFVDFKKLPDDYVNICVIGNDPLRDFLETTVADKSLHGLSLRVRKFDDVKEFAQVSDCSVVFFSRSVSSSGSKVVSEANEKGLLTICSVESITWGNCFIQFFEERNKSRIAVDLDNPAVAFFTVSSELLEVSVVRKKGEHDR